MQSPAPLLALAAPLVLVGCFGKLDHKEGEEPGVVDADGDGVPAEDDCDDGDASIGLGAEEECNGVDDDCDGEVDEGVGVTVYADADGDGFGDPATAQQVCEPAPGQVTVADDCDDTDAQVHPGAVEICNNRDDDCDGAGDDGPSTWYADADGDTHGDSTSPVEDCDEPNGAVARGGDCDDADASVYPGAEEECDGVDDDCDGVIDNGVLSVWYLDGDGDGYGGLSGTVTACEAPSGYVDNVDDCDDADFDVNPGATEVCNGIDDDCDGAVDDADSDLDLSTGTTWFSDADGDGHGDAATAVTTCTQPSGTVVDDTDCDDADASISPSATEVCNGVDDDCDGDTDDADGDLDTSTGSTFYADADLDGYGDAATTIDACDEPSGYTTDDTDCDDGDSDINPAATEVCNAVDDDCDGTADSTAVCPCPVEHRSGALDHPYMLCETKTDWADARDQCALYDYELATIDDSAEDAWLDPTIDSYSNKEWWIGYNDRSSEGTWVWDSGATSTYTQWAADEPDGGTSENCAELNQKHPRTGWVDGDCSTDRRYVCEAP